MAEAVETLHSRSEEKWWNKARSLKDIAEHLERTCKDKQALERRLLELVEENAQLISRCARTDSELAAITEAMGSLKSKPNGRGRQDAELAARERVLKDEFERKGQELRLEMNKEHRKMVERIEKLQNELAGCYCRQTSSGFVVHTGKPNPKIPRSPSRRVR